QFINDEFDAVLWTNARYEWNLPEKYQINAVRDGQIFLYEKALRTLETRFTNAPYLMGAQLSVPDIVLIQCLGWARVSRFESPKSEKIRAYIKTCISRPAYQRADKLRQEMSD
ncbi:MAG: glutathione S-transferase C-terminal domain-containing protein, partial [Proteobacteria bacterium]|nr:glutathione S-transferase C-terminal domain-containing protein [Pseudomonadota bacterium]